MASARSCYTQRASGLSGFLSDKVRGIGETAGKVYFMEQERAEAVLRLLDDVST